MSPRIWFAALAALATVRSTPPLVALAGEGRSVPGLPRFDLTEGTGDDAGFYAAAREYLAATGRLPLSVLLFGAVMVVGTATVALARWRRHEERPWIVAGAAAALGLLAAVPVLEMQASGSAVLGWSLVWALLLAPVRAAGEVDYAVAFGLAFGVLLVANVVALVATAYAGFHATGRRGVGLGAAAALAVWPLVTRIIAGPSAWENGTWFVDTGLALYTEPLSTALVAVALALLLRPASGRVALAAAGVLISFATLVKLTNGFFGLAAVVLVALFLGMRSALPLAAGGLAFVAPLLAYWPMGYVQDQGERDTLLPPDPFSLDYAARNWTNSILFDPGTLLVLLPLALVGALTLRRAFPLSLLLASIGTNVAAYTFYDHTAVHPRFLFASLPALFVLLALGASALTRLARGRRDMLVH